MQVVQEPERFLTYYFLDCSNKLRDYNTWSPLLNLLNDDYSIIVSVLQYYATLLDEDSPRLRLIWSKAGCLSYAEWQLLHPEQVQYVKRLSLQAIGLIEHRHVRALKKLEVYGVGDSRRTTESRAEIAHNVNSKDLMFGALFMVASISQFQNTMFRWIQRFRNRPKPTLTNVFGIF